MCKNKTFYDISIKIYVKKTKIIVSYHYGV